MLPALLGAAPAAPRPSGGGAAAGLPLEAAGGGGARRAPGLRPPCSGSWRSGNNDKNYRKKAIVVAVVFISSS